MVMGPRIAPPRSAMEAQAFVEAELAGERASALGRAGTRLEEALEAWQQLADDAVASAAATDAALDAVAAATYALLIQRECAGFRLDNLRWMRAHYGIPEAALRRMGRTTPRR